MMGFTTSVKAHTLLYLKSNSPLACLELVDHVLDESSQVDLVFLKDGATETRQTCKYDNG